MEKEYDLTGKIFNDVYEQWYDPIEIMKRELLKKRKEREQNTKEDLGI